MSKKKTGKVPLQEPQPVLPNDGSVNTKSKANTSAGKGKEEKMGEMTPDLIESLLQQHCPEALAEYQDMKAELIESRLLCAVQEDQINKQAKALIENSQQIDELLAENISLLQDAITVVEGYEHQVETNGNYARMHFTSGREGSDGVENGSGTERDEDDSSNQVRLASQNICALYESKANSEKNTAGKKGKRKKASKPTATDTSTGEENLILAQLEFTNQAPDGYETYVAELRYLEELCQEQFPSEQEGQGKENQPKKGPVTKGHNLRRLENANVTEKIQYYDINGNPVDSIDDIPKELEINGQTLKLMGYDKKDGEEVLVPATIEKVVYMTPKYVAKALGDSRGEAIISLAESLQAVDLTIDGLKKAKQEQLEQDEVEQPEAKEQSMKKLDLTAEQDRKEIPAPEVSVPEGSAMEAAGETVNPSKTSGESPSGKPQNPPGTKKYPKGTPTWKQKEYRVIVHVKPHVPIPLFKGSMWSPTMVAKIVFLHLVLFLPITRIWAASPVLLGGIAIPLSTMEALMQKVYTEKLKILVDEIKAELLRQSYIHADETPLRVLREANQKSYLWLYSSAVDIAQHQVRYFECHPGRGSEFALLMLCGFTGVLITDAYQGYAKVECIHAFCLLHARRRFYAATVIGSGKKAREKAKIGLAYFNDLFRFEKKLKEKGYTGKDFLTKRKELMGPIVKNIKAYCEDILQDPHVSKSGKLHDAASYYLNNEKELTMFLTDENIPLHNMPAEWMAKTVTHFRRSSLHCGSMAGATAIAGILTVIETARANNLDIYKYLLFLFENMRGDEWKNDKELIRSLLPWSEKAQQECVKGLYGTSLEKEIELVGGIVA